MTDLELFQKIRGIILAASGVPECIFADQAAIAPNGLYASVRITGSAENIGAPARRYIAAPDRKVEQQIKKTQNVTVEINIYRSGALDAARRLSNCNYRSDVRSKCIREKIEIVKIGAVNNLSALESAFIEERANLQMILSFKTLESVTINNIERVPLSVEDEKAREIIHFDIKEG